MAGRPPPLAAHGQGPFRGLLPPPSPNSEEVWEVNLNLFERPPLGNRAALGAHRAAMALFNKPETPKGQLRIAQNYQAPGAPMRNAPAAQLPLRVHPNVFKTPQKSRPTIPIPKAPKKPTGSERRSRNRKTRRQTRRLRK